MSYPERITKAAEEIARLDYPMLFKSIDNKDINPREDFTVNRVLESRMEHGAKVVAAQAEAIRKFVSKWMPEWSYAPELIDSYLITDGYIDPKTEEDGM